MLDQSAIEKELLIFLSQEILEDGVLVDCHTALEELGVDSFSLLELVMHLERSFGITIDPSTLTRDSTRSIRALAEIATQSVQPTSDV